MTNSNKFFTLNNISTTTSKIQLKMKMKAKKYFFWYIPKSKLHLKLTGKTEYIKNAVWNISCSKAAGQDNNITGQTGSQQVLLYLNLHLFATIASIQGIWELRGRGFTPLPHTSVSTSRNGMRRKFVAGISLMQWWRSMMTM